MSTKWGVLVVLVILSLSSVAFLMDCNADDTLFVFKHVMLYLLADLCILKGLLND
jgi:hypothetical protein